MGTDCWSWSEYDPHVAAIRKAWTEHYMRKGCNRWKASDLARRKTNTWPPAARG